MTHSKIICRKVDLLIGNQPVEVRFVRVVEDLLVSVVFHHDEEDVIETRNAAGMVLLSESEGRQ